MQCVTPNIFNSIDNLTASKFPNGTSFVLDFFTEVNAFGAFLSNLINFALIKSNCVDYGCLHFQDPYYTGHTVHNVLIDMNFFDYSEFTCSAGKSFNSLEETTRTDQTPDMEVSAFWSVSSVR